MASATKSSRSSNKEGTERAPEEGFEDLDARMAFELSEGKP
jgi:hypothetical protein